MEISSSCNTFATKLLGDKTVVSMFCRIQSFLGSYWYNMFPSTLPTLTGNV